MRLAALALLVACTATTMRERVIPPPSEQDAAAMRNAIHRTIGIVPIDAFESRTFRSQAGVVLPYRLLRPAAGAGSSLPLVVLFHGSGAIGSDNRAQIDLIAKSFAGRWSTSIVSRSDIVLVWSGSASGKRRSVLTFDLISSLTASSRWR